MNIKYEADKIMQKIADKAMSGVSQKGNIPGGEKKPFGNMPSLALQAAADGIVLLKNNNNMLPFDKSAKLAVFGRCQLDYFYVGYGSGGEVQPPYCVNIIDGLKNVGADINKGLLGFYESYCKRNPTVKGFWGHWPMCHDEAVLDDDTVKAASLESDTALVIIGRAAGEDRENQLIKGSYYLTDNEIKLLDSVTLWFDSVTVVLDCGNIIDMSLLDGYGDKISALLYAWQGGMESGNAVAKVLYGEVNPSGRLTDTVAKRYEDYPSSRFFGGKDYNNYSEDIYVGYRYFETFNRRAVLYPFGYGLSYTEFEINAKDFSFDEKNGRVSVTAQVKNISEADGRETVQLYFAAPQGKLGKPLRCLAGFEKTAVIAKGESQEVKISVDTYYLASFDDTGATGHKFSYLLEKGKYRFYLGKNVRDAKFVGSFTLDNDLVLEALDEICPPAKPFDRIKPTEKDGKIVGKRDTVPVGNLRLRTRIEKNLPKEIPFTDKKYNFSQVKSGDISVDEFISCLDFNELEALTRGEGYMDSELGAEGNAGAFGGVIPSLREKGVRAVITTDSPAGVRLNQYASLLPCGTALASSWDMDLVYAVACETGRELTARGSDILLAPGMNIHRNVLCGRNFEYFSEDPLLTGKIGEAFVKGVQVHGGSACPKHFACNNQETMRRKNDSRVSQRALREIYLKGFEICVKNAKPLNIMTSYNKINGVWSHYNYDLATTVLRKEWGYTGCVMTDWWMQKSKSPQFPNLRNNAYRVRSQVDVLMPGGEKTDSKYKTDSSLLETVGSRNGLTLAELQRTAKNVLNMILELDRDKNE